MSPAEACDAIRAHLARGAPWDACDAFRLAATAHPNDASLLYCGALAYARAGAAKRAHALLDDAQSFPQSDALRADALSLRGRLWKDAFARARDGAEALDAARRSRQEYRAAYELTRDPYPGINAATLCLLLGDRGPAATLAEEISAQLDQVSAATCWDHATAGEAALLRGDVDRAHACYATAAELAGRDAGSIASMRRQLHLIARAMPDAAGLLELLPSADVVAFAGHMIDLPGRASARFPETLQSAVAGEIRARLARMHRPIVYTSAACGADLIFAEAAIDAGAELNLVLPFDRDDFVRTSVACGGGAWVPRFERALSRAARLVMATEERHLGDDVLFEHAALLLEGLCVLRASQLETAPRMLCVIDAGAPGDVGGTRASHERWSRNVGTPETIDLQALRIAASDDRSKDANATSASPERSARTDTPASGGARPHRTLKTMLFSDFAGYSRLHDAFAPLFQQRFLEIGAREIDAALHKPVEAKTWGDSLYAVFESARDAADFALGFIADMRAVDWRAAGMPEDSQIRVALHTGPVFDGFDPVMGRRGHFGSSVTRAARIEPVTPPGMVYASEAFAATLAASGADDCSLEYVGVMPLAKDYGTSTIYRLERR